MTAHDWFLVQREGFVARALEPADERLMRDHLTRCEECRAAVALLERDLALLGMAVEPVALRPGYAGRVVRELTQRPSPGWQRWLLPAAAAMLVFALGTIRSARRDVAELSVALGRAESRATAVADTLSVLRKASTVLQASFATEGYRGGLTIFADEESHRWNVIVHGLPEPGPGRRYMFWFVTADGMVRGAEVICEGGRPAMLTLPMPAGARGIRGGALTVEAIHADPQVASGLTLAHVEI